MPIRQCDFKRLPACLGIVGDPGVVQELANSEEECRSRKSGLRSCILGFLALDQCDILHQPLVPFLWRLQFSPSYRQSLKPIGLKCKRPKSPYAPLFICSGLQYVRPYQKELLITQEPIV